MPHPSSEAFYAVLAEAKALHDLKQADYGSDADPFANVRSAEKWGLKPSQGACIRIGDKVARLQTWFEKGKLANESVEDAYLDLLVYAGIGLVLHREEQERAGSDQPSLGVPTAPEGQSSAICGAECRSCQPGTTFCDLPPGHEGSHRGGKDTQDTCRHSFIRARNET